MLTSKQKNLFKKLPHPIQVFANKASNKTFYVYNYLYSKLSSKPLIHIIGDSHVSVFNNKKLFITHYIGPATMHNLNKENSSTKSKEKLFKIINTINRKKDVVILSFGEIDCRIHICYQYEKQDKKFTISELIDKTISNYGCVLEKIKLAGVKKICIYGIPAARKIKNIVDYPFYGSPETRSSIYRKFNDKLKDFCKNNGYPYINIYPIVSDKNGFLLDEYASDEIHLNGKITEFARQQIPTNFS